LSAVAFEPAGAADLAALGPRALALRFASPGAKARGDTLASATARMGRLLEAGYSCAFVTEGAARVGYVLWRAEPEDARVLLRHFFLDEGARGRGLGRRTFRAWRDRFAPGGAAVTLDVIPDNATAGAFWRALGFDLMAHRMILRPGAGPQETPPPPLEA
jgi:ribosomal protein S18 acetylase RimI-like enzyme